MRITIVPCIYTAFVSRIFGLVIPTSFSILVLLSFFAGFSVCTPLEIQFFVCEPFAAHGHGKPLVHDILHRSANILLLYSSKGSNKDFLLVKSTANGNKKLFAMKMKVN